MGPKPRSKEPRKGSTVMRKQRKSPERSSGKRFVGLDIRNFAGLSL